MKVLSIVLLAVLSGCACESSTWKNPYGKPPTVGLGSGVAAYYGSGTTYYGIQGAYGAPQPGPFGYSLQVGDRSAGITVQACRHQD